MKGIVKRMKGKPQIGRKYLLYIYIYIYIYIYTHIYIYNSRLMSYKYIKISKFSNKKTNNQFKIGQKTSHQKEYADGK